jgi:hypothetical protein
MNYKSCHFTLQELVCPHVFNAYGLMAWSFFDDKLLQTMDLIGDQIGAIYINNWHLGGEFDERGFRCIQCSIVRQHIKEGMLYVSAHMTGQAVDFTLKNMSATEFRLWATKNYQLLPYPIRIEKSVPWVHLDTRDEGKGKVYLFASPIQ